MEKEKSDKSFSKSVEILSKYPIDEDQNITSTKPNNISARSKNDIEFDKRKTNAINNIKKDKEIRDLKHLDEKFLNINKSVKNPVKYLLDIKLRDFSEIETSFLGNIKDKNPSIVVYRQQIM